MPAERSSGSESLSSSLYSGDLFDEDDSYRLGWGVQETLCSGYFKKENAKTFGFTKRWYKLQGHVLLYYENEHKSKARGVIDVSDATISIKAIDLLLLAPSAVVRSQRKPSGCYADMVLQIQTPSRTHTLWPKFNEDLLPWQAAVTVLGSPRSTTASQPEVEAARQATQQLIEQSVGHLYSTPMKLERLAQCCRRLGVREEEEPHLMWLVHECSRATAAANPVLPGDWAVYKDEHSGQLYYHNVHLQSSTWDHPLTAYFDYLLRVLRRETIIDIGAQDAAGTCSAGGGARAGRQGTLHQLGSLPEDGGTGTHLDCPQTCSTHTRVERTPSPGASSRRMGGGERVHGLGESGSKVGSGGRRVGLDELLVALFGKEERKRQCSKGGGGPGGASAEAGGTPPTKLHGTTFSLRAGMGSDGGKERSEEGGGEAGRWRDEGEEAWEEDDSEDEEWFDVEELGKLLAFHPVLYYAWVFSCAQGYWVLADG